MAVKTIEWKNNRVVMIDQRLLPEREVYKVCRDYRAVAEAIRGMAIRGAPAIGVAAAMGVALGCLKAREKGFDSQFDLIVRVLSETRPTAVNLFWALGRMRKVYQDSRERGIEEVKRLLIKEALKIHADDIAANKQLGRLGADLLGSARRIMTHCNAGALATAGYGTALGVIRALKESGKKIEVWVNETRPLLQGSRLTAWELKKEKIPATLVTDSMAGYLMQSGGVDAVIVGCDRVAANGDVANKIGTYGVAVLAKRHGIPFYVAGPTSSIDLNCPSGMAFPSSSAPPRKSLIFLAERWRPRG